MAGNSQLLKVALIRDPGHPVGVPAPVRLGCPRGARPLTDLDTRADVRCRCDRLYAYNGWVQENKE